VHHWCTVQAAFLVSAAFAGRGPLGSPASSASTSIKRLLPIAAVPAAMAGLAAAFALGNSPAAAPMMTDAAGHDLAATTATSQASASAEQVVAITRQSATGLPVVRLNAARLAAIKPKGKHHRTLPAKYVVKPGDTLASVAEHLYHSSDYWPVLYSANHSKIKDANEITAGQALAVPAKPAKIPSAPKAVTPSPAPATSTVSYGESNSSASTAAAAPAQTASTSAGSSGSTSSAPRPGPPTAATPPTSATPAWRSRTKCSTTPSRPAASPTGPRTTAAELIDRGTRRSGPDTRPRAPALR